MWRTYPSVHQFVLLCVYCARVCAFDLMSEIKLFVGFSWNSV